MSGFISKNTYHIQIGVRIGGHEVGIDRSAVDDPRDKRPKKL